MGQNKEREGVNLICIHYMLPDNKLQFNPRRGGSHSVVINKWLATCIIYQTVMPSSSSSAMEISLLPDLFIHSFIPFIHDGKWSTVSHLWQFSFTLSHIHLCNCTMWDQICSLLCCSVWSGYLKYNIILNFAQNINNLEGIKQNYAGEIRISSLTLCSISPVRF